VAALQIIGNTLYVGGAFQNGADIAAADFLVACDLTTGAASSTVANDGDFNSGVSALTADSNGTLYAGGGFINLTGIPAADHVASYDGAWHAMGSGAGAGGGAVDSFVRSLTARGTDVYVGTDAVDIAGIPQADHIAKWDAQGQDFSALGSNSAGTGGWFDSFAFLNGMATYGSLVFVAGSFQNPDGHATADDVAYFDGSRWHPLGSDGAGNGPVNSQVNALAVFHGSLLAGGNFTSAGGDSQAASVAGHALRLPDAAVGGAKGGPFTGNNIYGASGADQVRHVTVTRGKHDSSFVRIQNDGPVAAIFHVEGLGGARGVKAHWFAGQTNITSAVVNGTYDTGTIDAGDDVVLKVVVDVARTSARSATVTTRVSASGAPVDGVRIQVRATG
jgi:hypothetical protein